MLKISRKVRTYLVALFLFFNFTGCLSIFSRKVKTAREPGISSAQIDSTSLKKPNDAPLPLAPAEAIKSFKLPDGFRIELVASEPLIKEPTAICWDEKGRLYVSELHGYNLEGQLEIEELNKTGLVDTVVQRIQAADKYKEKADEATYGVVKRLTDTNGDGVMDKAEVLADKLPPAYGLCAARGGIIVAGQAEIVFLADKDDDGKAETIETLFTGFQSGALERGLNAPQYGPDGYIYFGRGWSGGTVTGPNLKNPVKLPSTNFRIKPDGSAIEPVTGSTHTIGHAFTADGYSFFTNTWKHALYAVPIPWPYLMRNPHAAISSLEADASDFSTVFPVAPVHPWKLARSNQKGWKELYDQYGLAESAAEGYFTSCCSPLIYQDNAFPTEFQGNLFVCEPAQSLVHRSIVEPDGTGLKVRRAETEKSKEFLASTDSWFRPVSITHGPDGSLYVTDMYREIIEDYSAVPRFMQQKYGLSNGANHGRIWRVSPLSLPALAQTKHKDLTRSNLEKELESPHSWQRKTAERLIREQEGDNAPALSKKLLNIRDLTSKTVQADFVFTLRRADTGLKHNVAAARRLATLGREISDERMLLQLVLSLGYSKDRRVFDGLTNLARKHGNIRWLPDAVMTGVHERAGEMISALIQEPGRHGHNLLDPLAAGIAARGNLQEIERVLTAISNTKNPEYQAAALIGLNRNIKFIRLSKTGSASLNRLLAGTNPAVKGKAVELAGKLKIGDLKALNGIRIQAKADAANDKLSTQERLAAVTLLADSPDDFAAFSLINAWSTGTLPVKSAILDALILRGNRLNYLIAALSDKKIETVAFNSLQRTQLLERADSHLRPKVEEIFAQLPDSNKEAVFLEYAKALEGKNNIENGAVLFKQMCSICHKVGNVGISVGPDLKLAYQNSRETLLKSILWPSEKLSSGYDTYSLTTNDNETHLGVLVNESANSVVLKQAGGAQKTVFRKDIKSLRSTPVSLMPEYGQALTPQNCADIIEWVKSSLAEK